jgi:hypothetical protein
MVSLNLLRPIILTCKIVVSLCRLPQDTLASSNPIIEAENRVHITTAPLNRIATSPHMHHVYDVFVIFAEYMLTGPRLCACAVSFGPALAAETTLIHAA